MNLEIVDKWNKKDFLKLFDLIQKEFNCKVVWNKVIDEFGATLCGNYYAVCDTPFRLIAIKKVRHISNRGLVHILIHELGHLVIHNLLYKRIDWLEEYIVESVANIVTGYNGEWCPSGMCLIDYCKIKLSNTNLLNYIPLINHYVGIIQPKMELIFRKLEEITNGK